MPKATIQTVLYCYDGSEDARHALVTAARHLDDGASIVLTVWNPAWVALPAMPYAMLSHETMERIDAATKDAGERLAVEGAKLIPGSTARSQQSTGPVWNDILKAADKNHAKVIVVGSRGLGALKSTLLGSVSHGLMNHSRTPVLIVPPADRRAPPAADQQRDAGHVRDKVGS